MIEPFAASIAATPIEAASVSKPLVRGRLAVIDRDHRSVDDAFFAIPKILAADHAGQIGTVALVHCEPVYMGDFRLERNTTRVIAKAYNTTCNVNVVDWVGRRSTGSGWVNTEARPPRKLFNFFYTNDWHAPRPTKSIAEWLSKLPRE